MPDVPSIALRTERGTDRLTGFYRVELGGADPYTCTVADVFTKAKRSKVMAAIRSTGNKDTEIKLAKILRAAGITGWRRHEKLPGRPDFAFRRERLAVFVDGCFWHGCRKHCRMPKTNTAFWKLVCFILRKRGWRVLRLWEHSLKNPVVAARTLQRALDSAAGKR